MDKSYFSRYMLINTKSKQTAEPVNNSKHPTTHQNSYQFFNQELLIKELIDGFITFTDNLKISLYCYFMTEATESD